MKMAQYIESDGTVNYDRCEQVLHDLIFRLRLIGSEKKSGFTVVMQEEEEREGQPEGWWCEYNQAMIAMAVPSGPPQKRQRTADAPAETAGKGGKTPMSKGGKGKGKGKKGKAKKPIERCTCRGPHPDLLCPQLK